MRTRSPLALAELKYLVIVFAILLLSPIAFAQATKPKPNRRRFLPPVVEAPASPVLPSPLPALPLPLSAQALPYPKEFIQRPFTLPVNLSDVTLQASAVNLSSHNADLELPLYLLDFTYRKPLTSDFNLILNPFPFGLQYQPKRTSTVLTGVSWIVGYQFQGNFGVWPQFSSFFRYFLSSKSALDMQLQYSTFIPFKKAPSIWRGTFRVGPIFQISESLAVSPRLYLWIDNVQLTEAYGPGRTKIENQKLTAESAQFQVPLSAWAGWNINSTFDLTSEYTLYGAGLSGNSYAHLLTVGVTTRF